MDTGAWGATVHGVAKSWTRLKQLSTHTHNAMSPTQVVKMALSLFGHKNRVIRQLLASYSLGNLKPCEVTKGLTQLNVKHMHRNI